MSLTEITEVRRTVEENTKLAIPCYNRDYDPYGWAITVVRADDFTDYKVTKENKQLLEECIADAKAGTANQQAADRINENTAKVKTEYKKVMIHKNDPKYQLPKVKNPGYLEIDPNWDQAKILIEQNNHERKVIEYETYKLLEKANMMYLNQIIGIAYWYELNTGNHLKNNHTVQEILEHIESKCNKEEHIDVKKELDNINEQPSFKN